MNQILEFIGNHPYLFMALGVTAGMIAYTEYMRLFSGAKMLTPLQATQLMNEGEALFLDVRDDAEFKRGHLLDATHIPVNSLDKRMHELERHKDKPVIVYCDSGARAQRAAAKLKKNGFEKLNSLAGGVTAWEKASLPLVTR